MPGLPRLAALSSSHGREAAGTISGHSHRYSSSAVMGRVFHMARLAVEAEGPEEPAFSCRTVFSAGLWVLQGLLFDNVSCIVVDVFLLDAAWNKLSESGCIVFSFLTFVLG